jgi:enoyl-CoA hydratase/carnithine racemase
MTTPPVQIGVFIPMEVELDIRDHIAVLTLNRPNKLNACTPSMYAEIYKHLLRMDEDPSIRVGVITSSTPKSFSVGTDLGIGGDSSDGGASSASIDWRISRETDLASGRELEIQVPLIAAIEGYCLGGGLELSLACDIRIAGDGSQFGSPEVRWGLVSGYAAAILPRMVGQSNALYMLLSDGYLDAATALRLGLVQEVVGDTRAFERAMELANRIAHSAPMSVRMTKELVLRSRGPGVADSLRLYKSFQYLIDASPDRLEGASAFQEGREPLFS